MVYGQWLGQVDGGLKGELLVNIDRSTASQIGSISFLDQGSTQLPTIAKIRLNKINETTYEGLLSGFIGFAPNGFIIRPGDPNIPLSVSGTVKFSILENGRKLAGEWETSLQEKGSFSATNISGARPRPVQKVLKWAAFKEIIKSSPAGLFYRGHQTSTFPLQTAFHRREHWDLYRYHDSVLYELFDYLGMLNNTRYKLTDGEDFGAALYLAQHHEFPTPLLDWTTSPYISAFFAFRPFEPPAAETGSVRIYVFDAERWASSKAVYANGHLLSPGAVIKPLRLPVAGNRRAVAQDSRSIFTNIDDVYGVIELLTGKDKPFINYYDLDRSDRDEALSDLEKMGIHEFRLFPDLDHACKMLRKRYFGS